MRINTNVSALNANRHLDSSTRGLETSIQRLSSGFRINRSGDDAAGLAIANKLRAESRSLQQAGRNASQASAMLQIADGAVNTVGGILDRLKELASQSNSDNIGAERDKLNSEFQELIAEIGRIASTTKFQGSALVDGTFGSQVDTNPATSTALAVTGVSNISISGAQTGTFALTSAGGNVTLTAGGVAQTISDAGGAQVLDFSAHGVKITTVAGFVQNSLNGTNVVVTGGVGRFMVSSSGDFAGNDLISLGSVNLSTGATGLNLQGLDVLSSANAQTSLTRIDLAIDAANNAVGTLGAAQSRIDFARANVSTLVENVQAAESTIRDADIALETVAFTKFQILQQAGTAMLAQANQAPQTVLSLLR